MDQRPPPLPGPLLSDRLWAACWPLVAAADPGLDESQARVLLAALLYRALTGVPWQALPQVDPAVAAATYARWQARGLLAALAQQLGVRLELDQEPAAGTPAGTLPRKELPRMLPVRTYIPLRRYLAALPPDQQTVTLTFAELEQLLQFPLPASAWTDAYWATSSVARRYWQPQGFTATLARGPWRVTFRRRAS